MPRRRTRAVATRTRVVRPQVKVVRVPSGVPARRRAGAMVRRGVSRAAAAARDEKHTLTALIAAGGLGLAKRQGISLPKIPQIGTAGTYGLAAWVAARMTKNKTMAHVATGLLSVSAFQLAAGETLSGDDDDDDEW